MSLAIRQKKAYCLEGNTVFSILLDRITLFLRLYPTQVGFQEGILVTFFFFLTQACSIIVLLLQKKHKSAEVKILGMFLCA